MIVDLGAENTDLIIAEGETIWLRSIPIGGNNFTESLVKSFKLKFPKAEELKRNAATSKYGRQILQAMRPVFADLVAEIQRSIGFYASVHRDSRIARVLALGGTFRLPGTAEIPPAEPAAGRFADRPAWRSVGPRREGRRELQRQPSLFGQRVWTGVAGDGGRQINSSLLPQMIRRERMWRKKTKWFAAAAALFVAGTGIAYGSYYSRHLQADADHLAYSDKIDKEIKAATALDGQWSQVAGAGGADRSMIESLNGLLAGRDVWSNMVRDVFSAFPPEPATPEELKTLAAIPRGKRQVVAVRDFTHRYVADISPMLAMKDPDFSLLAAPPGQAQQQQNRPMSMPQMMTPQAYYGGGAGGASPYPGAGGAAPYPGVAVSPYSGGPGGASAPSLPPHLPRRRRCAVTSLPCTPIRPMPTVLPM